MARNNFLRTAKNVIRSRFTKKLQRVVLESFEEINKEVQQEFENHPITRELDDQVFPSKILQKNNWPRAGTLFGFMGFNGGNEPIRNLRNFLFEQGGFNYELNKSFIGRTFGILGFLKSPSEEELQKAGIQLDGWGDGRSWPAVLEDEGIENLNHFLSKPAYGRSSQGIQVKPELNPGAKLDKMNYLTPIFKKAAKKFEKTIQKRARQR